MITVPLLAFFYLGSARSIQLCVFALIIVDLGVFYVLSDGGRQFPQHVPYELLSALGIVSTVCAALYVSMMALYYSSLVNSQAELEREVSRRRLEAARALREATAKADQASRAKSEFLAKMSYELRTPLNAVIGYSAMLLEDAEACQREQQASDLSKIQSAGQYLLRLINDLLELAKLEAGKMDLYVETFALSPLINDLADAHRERIAAGGNTLVIECPDDIGLISGDAAKLGTIVLNVLGNAAKFTRNGRIVLVASRSDGSFSISVSDTGPGIEARRLATLFEKFDGDEAGTTSHDGTGSGLALSRRLCRLMCGDLTVQSEHGSGSCFTICLPVAMSAERLGEAAAPGADHDSPDAESAERSVLVIDDDPNVLYVLQGSLSRLGYTVIVAADGFEGIELARETRPSLILLDTHMPELTGWQVLKAIRSDKALKRCPVVMLTVDDDLQRGRATGANAYMRKPLDPEALQRLLAQVLLDGGADVPSSSRQDAAMAA